VHLALTATCQIPMHNLQHPLALLVVDLQVNVARSLSTPAASQSNPTNQIVFMTDEAEFLPPFAFAHLINLELAIVKSMGNQKHAPVRESRMTSFQKLILKAILYVVW
jgi:hypothetical protein